MKPSALAAQKGENLKGRGVSGNSSPVFSFDNDRRVRI